MSDHVERTLPLGVPDGRVRAVAQEHGDVLPVAPLLEKEMQRGHALRVPEVHVRPVVKESLGRGKVAPLDGAEKRRFSSSATGSTRAPLSTSKSIASTSS